MKIAIFGGSFNPIHKGHIKIAQTAITELNLDKLYFVPAYKSPFKSKEKYVDAHHRVAMLEEVMPEKSAICPFEINRKGISYTIDTVKYFKSKFPNDEIFLILGSDNLKKLHKWKNIAEISQMTKIIIFKRDKQIDKTNMKSFGCQLLNNEIFHYSSTEFIQGKLEVCEDKTRKYIGKNYLYILEILKNTLDAKRMKHCQATGFLAAEYAKNLKLDAKKAWFAGLTHDVTKNFDNSTQRNFLNSLNIDDSNILDYQLHQITGSLWLQKKYFVQDEEIVHAVSVHTSLSDNLNTLDKIVFMADKLAEGRKFPDIQKVRELAFSDFDAAFKFMVKHVWDFNLSQNKQITNEQEKLYQLWSK